MPATKLTDRQLLILGTIVERGLAYEGDRHGIGPSPPRMGGFVVFQGWKDFPTEDFPVRVTHGDVKALYDRNRQPRLLEYMDREKVSPRLREMGVKPDHVFFRAHPMAPTPAAREVLAEERARYDRLVSALREREDNPRLVVSKRAVQHMTTWGYAKDFLPGAGHLYVVTGETEKTFRVAHYGAAPSWSDRDPLITGSGKGMSLSKDFVFAIDVTPAQFAAMKEATRSYQGALDRAREQSKQEEEEALAPIRTRLARREEQLLAMLEDEVRGAMAPDAGAPKP